MKRLNSMVLGIELIFVLFFSGLLHSAPTDSICYDWTSLKAIENFNACFELTHFSEIKSPRNYDYKDPESHPSFPQSLKPVQYRPPLNFIHLMDYPKTTKIMPHFQLQELMPLRQGDYGLYSNTVLNFIEEMRRTLDQPLLIHSAYRSPEYNRSLPGAIWSRHQYGDAIDFHVEGVSFNELKNLCISYGASFYQLYKSHIHCDWRNTPLNEEIFGVSHDQARGPLTFEDFIHEVQKTLKIQIIQDSDYYYLSVPEDFIEDQVGEIRVRWKVKFNDSSIRFFVSPKIQLKKGDQPKQVFVELGESLSLTVNLKSSNNAKSKK